MLILDMAWYVLSQNQSHFLGVTVTLVAALLSDISYAATTVEKALDHATYSTARNY